MNRSVRESVGQKTWNKMQDHLLQGHILDTKRIMVPAKMFWIFEKENIYPKENRALRLILMYYWDSIAGYPNVEDFKIFNEPINYYNTVKRALDNREYAFINDIYHIWRQLRVNALKYNLKSYNVDVKDACKVYDFIISQLRSIIYNQKIEMFNWVYCDDFYKEANKVTNIITDLRNENNSSCLRKWPYLGAIYYYWDLVFKRPMELKEYQNNHAEYKLFIQYYERYSDTEFIEFQIINLNQNYPNLKIRMTPREIEFVKDILYALKDIKLNKM